MDKSGVKIYDIECLSNFFCYCDIDRDTGEKMIFVIHKSRNDYKALIEYLTNNKILQVGFNNISYDAQIIHYLTNNYYIFKDKNGDELARLIYKISNDVISRSHMKERPLYNTWDFTISQLDLFKIWHFDNKAKSTRLKDLQVAMKWYRVQDMPLHHNHKVNKDEIPMILDYCDNDIMSTFEFYKKSREKIDLRKALGEKYNIDVLNANDGKIGEMIFSKIISERKDIDKQSLKSMRTMRDEIKLTECILPIIKFTSKEFNSILDRFNNITLTKSNYDNLIQTKKVLDNFSVNYKGFKYDYGLGGIHGCTNPGIYKSDNEYIIKTCDVTSLYPRLGIEWRFYPEHLGEDFVDIYDDISKDRNIAKKKAKADKSDLISKAINEGLKYTLNIAYGKSNEVNSFLYDPKYTMQITINGQLMLSMLAERLANAGFRIIMINTDGLECIVPRDKIDEYDNICQQWQKETKLSLEFSEYERMIIRDVNNYIAIPLNGEDVKYKGCFEIVKDYHKDPSFPIVPIALSEYFVKNIPIEDVIMNIGYEYKIFKEGKYIIEKTDILDYAGRAKFKSDSYGELRYINDDLKLVCEKQQKTTRYLITRNGGILYKVFESDKQSIINKGYLCREFNNMDKNIFQVKQIQKDINYQFFIDECNKIIDVIEPKYSQLTLF